MDLGDLEGLVVATAFILACAWVLVRLLQPVVNALAERLRPIPLQHDDAMRNELQALVARVSELERRTGPPELTSGAASASELEEG